ncbi:hypothetical protein Tco_0858653 [Tanacetum coccineum]|uniref:Uncharacterized protein n=1 Tax=Tanacetum coccineum TaxID=301880 RepID=A0ABQ5BDI4_9ASTR
MVVSIEAGRGISGDSSRPKLDLVGLVGFLMYLTAVGPTLYIAVCMCARYQAKPTKSNQKPIKPYAEMRIMRDVKIQEEVHREVLSFLEIDWLVWSSMKKQRKARQYLNTEAEYTLPCLDVVLKSFGCDHSSKTTDLTTITCLCIVITKVLLLFAVTTSITLALNTLTYGTISSESKWKIECTLALKHIEYDTISSRASEENRVVETLLRGNELKLADYSHKRHYQETFRFLLPRLGMKSLTPETLRRLQEGEDE